MQQFSITVKEVEGIPLLMPKIVATNWPIKLRLANFPDYCGAGEGFGEKIIPETYYGLSVRHVCFIHDITHTIFDPTRDLWHLSNQIMLVNGLNTIRARTKTRLLRFIRNRRALLYYDGVETETGFRCFLNRPGGNQGQAEYSALQDPAVLHKFKMLGVTEMRC